MKTTSPIATISYNSLPFLKGILESLVKTDKITWWALIEHQPEEDEKKVHYHLYMLPGEKVDTNWLRKRFIEPIEGKPALACLPIGKSDFANWYWYVIHDTAYLASKNQTRKFHYDPSEVMTSDRDYLEELVRTNPNPKAELLKVLDLIKAGASNMEIALRMNVSVRNLGYFISNVEFLREGLLSHNTDRGGSEPHPEIGVDENGN